ncbi:M48 family metallopeptidase [Salinimicrobium soli]|uniref:M48 family metallopeptidase n=1 Tax=Salinimicrobium soli TaxID=1254399 RepID=UPI003AADCC2C
MPKVAYGNKVIEYSIQEKDELKSHYITVERGNGVVLKGKPVTEEQSQRLVLKRAQWILDKLKLVEAINEGDIVTGSRIQYLGRKYYTQLSKVPELAKVQVDFNESKFQISVPEGCNQKDIQQALEKFFRVKAIEKIQPRLERWSRQTGFTYTNVKFMKMNKRWGSCTVGNAIHINIDAVRLPYSLIDYLVVHELVHTIHKNHSKAFWAELSKYIPNWKHLDEQMSGMKL